MKITPPVLLALFLLVSCALFLWIHRHDPPWDDPTTHQGIFNAYIDSRNQKDKQ